MNRKSIAASAVAIVLGAVALTGCGTAEPERPETCTIPEDKYPDNISEYTDAVFVAMYELSREYVSRRALPIKEYDDDKVEKHITSALVHMGCVRRDDPSSWAKKWEDEGQDAMEVALNYRYPIPADRKCVLKGMNERQIAKELKPRAIKRVKSLIQKGLLTDETVYDYYDDDAEGPVGRWLASLGCEVDENLNSHAQEWRRAAGDAMYDAAYDLMPEEEYEEVSSSGGGSSGGGGGPKCRLSFSLGGGFNASCSVSTP